MKTSNKIVVVLALAILLAFVIANARSQIGGVVVRVPALQGKALVLRVGGKRIVLGRQNKAHDLAPAVVATDLETWLLDLATALGNPRPSPATEAFLVAWARAEGTPSDIYNPLATTKVMPGSRPYNATGVQVYASPEQGLEATVKTLSENQPGYGDIVAGIRGNDPDLALTGLTNSPWGTHADLIREVYQEELQQNSAQPQVVQVAANTQAPGRKSRVTESMEVGAAFNSTGDVWCFQSPNCQHLGVDYLGPEGTPVYAPFDLVFSTVGHYDDAPRFGDYLVGTLADGCEYYSGHLKDIRSFAVGQTIPAGTPIGFTNELDHTHVQLSCGGELRDFQTYYDAH